MWARSKELREGGRPAMAEKYQTHEGFGMGKISKAASEKAD